MAVSQEDSATDETVTDFPTMKLLVVLAVNLVLASFGRCGEERGTKCLNNCEKGRRPVCAKNRRGDWKTFPSHCALADHNCLSDDVFEFIAFDECDYYLV